MSGLQKSRAAYVPPVPDSVKCLVSSQTVKGEAAAAAKLVRKHLPNLASTPTISFRAADPSLPKPTGAKQVPLNIGVVFCGRQAPGGHNVVAAVYDGVKEISSGGKVYGFIGGTDGLRANQHLELTSDILRSFRNQGGYHLLGRTKDKISSSHFDAVHKTCSTLALDGLVLIGSVYSLTDAAYLSEHFIRVNCTTKVVGVPASIDNEMKCAFLPQSLGFDTATKVYSQLIGNIATDGSSARKYYYFMRLMGRSPSHIALECGLQTQCNITLLSEDIESRKCTLKDVVDEICDVVCARQPRNFGTILIPEGLIEAIPEFRALITELDQISVATARGAASDTESAGQSRAQLLAALTPYTRALFIHLPERLQDQLLLERTCHDTIQLAQVSTEEMLAHFVKAELAKRKAAGKYSGKFSSNTNFFGYQARSSLPSNFDCSLGTTLGRIAVKLVAGGLTGYAAAVSGLQHPVAKWRTGAVSTAALMRNGNLTHHSIDVVDGKIMPAIGTTFVDLKGKACLALKKSSEKWKTEDDIVNYGPIQFEGAPANAVTATLQIEDEDYLDRISALHKKLEQLRLCTLPGSSLRTINVAEQLLSAALNILNTA